MIELNLKDIVLNVDFSPIYMGQTESEVVKILGEPEGRNDTGTGSVLFSYGGYEFYFFDNELHYFQNDNLKANCVNHTDWILYQNNHFKINPWFVSPNKDISMKEVISLLKKEKAEFSIENQKVAGVDYRVGEVKFIELLNGVSMNFEKKTTAINDLTDEMILEGKELIFTDEMEFVLFAIRYEHFNQLE